MANFSPPTQYQSYGSLISTTTLLMILLLKGLLKQDRVNKRSNLFFLPKISELIIHKFSLPSLPTPQI